MIKLGGSVITRKRLPSRANMRAIERISEELAKREEKMLLIYGAGSFGHIPVQRYKLHLGYRSRKQIKGFAETKLTLLKQEQILVSVLARQGVPVVPMVASSCMVARSGRLVHVDVEPFARLLKLGLVPLVGGDVVLDREIGFSVVSGDQMAAYLAERLGAKLIVFGTDVDGLYSGDPKRDPNARLIPDLSYTDLISRMKMAGESSAPDVTAGMLGKLRESVQPVRRGIEVIIMNLNRPADLHPILDGKTVRCTRIVPKIAAP